MALAAWRTPNFRWRRESSTTIPARSTARPPNRRRASAAGSTMSCAQASADGGEIGRLRRGDGWPATAFSPRSVRSQQFVVAASTYAPDTEPPTHWTRMNSMARRSEIKGICQRLLSSFVSRYNDLQGYWALGKFQKYLQETQLEELSFNLIDANEGLEERLFPETSDHYRNDLKRQMASRNIPATWVETACIKVRTVSPNALNCTIEIESDLGRKFTSKVHVTVNPHDPAKELRRAEAHFGPS